MAEQLLNGRYRLLRPLGTGGMASVFLAEDLRLGRRVAVKILHPQFATDPAFVARFEQEARMAAALSHPSLVQVYDVGHDGDRYYIVMEYVDGETLKTLISRDGALPVPRALAIMSGLLGALDFAHTHNLIHRDVKAQNILLTPDGEVKVTDFGIARELGTAGSPTLTVTGMVIGTVQYFSPEQAQGRPATPQSDVYAAGVVLFEMLTGRLPFDAENPLAVAMQQINQPPLPPTRLNAAIPPAVERIVLTALAKNPAERFASAAEIKAAIDAVRSGASEATRLATRATPAATATGMRQPPAPGVIRASTRPTQQVTSRTPVEPPAGRATQRVLWLVIAALTAVVAAIAGVYVTGGALPGFSSSPTPTPTVTPSPSATRTPHPTATALIVVPPTASHTPRPTVTPTETPSPQAPTKTPTPPKPSATNTPVQTNTDTPSPTAQPTTPAPTETPTSAPSDTPTSAPSDTPTAQVIISPTVPSAQTPTMTPAPNGGAPAIQFSPVTATPGDTVGVIGSGWPDGATVTLLADFGNGTQTLDRAPVTSGGFSTAITLPPDLQPGIYTVTAQDDQGDSANQTLTVTR